MRKKQIYIPIIFGILAILIYSHLFPFLTLGLSASIEKILLFCLYILGQYIIFNKLFSRYSFYSARKEAVNCIILVLFIIVCLYPTLVDFNMWSGLISIIWIYYLTVGITLTYLTIYIYDYFVEGTTDYKIIIDFVAVVLAFVILLNHSAFIFDRFEEIDPYRCYLSDKESKNACYFDKAKDMRNPSICKKITNDAKYRDNCYITVVKRTGDLNGCEKVLDLEQRDFCYLQSRIMTIAICEKIVKQTNKDICYENMAEKTLNGSLCGKVNDSEKRNYCYLLSSIINEDFAMCEKMDDGIDRDGCYSSMAIEKLNKTLCGKVNDEGKRNYCYFDMAHRKKDENICELVNHSILRNKCYLSIAKIKNDSNICGKIDNNPGKRNNCYLSIANKNKDTTICLKISDKLYEDYCMSLIKENLT